MTFVLTENKMIVIANKSQVLSIIVEHLTPIEIFTNSSFVLGSIQGDGDKGGVNGVQDDGRRGHHVVTDNVRYRLQ